MDPETRKQDNELLNRVTRFWRKLQQDPDITPEIATQLTAAVFMGSALALEEDEDPPWVP